MKISHELYKNNSPNGHCHARDVALSAPHLCFLENDASESCLPHNKSQTFELGEECVNPVLPSTSRTQFICPLCQLWAITANLSLRRPPTFDIPIALDKVSSFVSECSCLAEVCSRISRFSLMTPKLCRIYQDTVLKKEKSHLSKGKWPLKLNKTVGVADMAPPVGLAAPPCQLVVVDMALPVGCGGPAPPVSVVNLAVTFAKNERDAKFVDEPCTMQ